MRLNKLFRHTGYMLVFLPCAIGTGLYGNIITHYKEVFLFFAGAVIMRGAGCIINDIFDRNIDKHVERTKNRPIADGRVSIMEALLVFSILTLIGLFILMQFSIEAIMIGFVGMFLLLTYPLAKRFTNWPQAYLGLAFNIGVLIAVEDSQHHLTWPSIVLYIGCIFWTLYYDTIYAFSDLKDDKKIGVKSLARFLETKDYKTWLKGFGVSAAIIIAYALLLTDHNILIVLIGTLLAIYMIFWQVDTLDIHDMQNCMDRFKYNNYVGGVWAVVALL